ncbi:MAG: hypothetical protein LBQ01_01360 [Prevotellaceae bacterium]|jgi:hypothetical protein|nr:hypothetical protein [Prevotellaceae bacterium]
MPLFIESSKAVTLLLYIKRVRIVSFLQQAFSRLFVIAGNEAIRKVVDFWIASSLPLLAMTTRRGLFRRHILRQASSCFSVSVRNGYSQYLYDNDYSSVSRKERETGHFFFFDFVIRHEAQGFVVHACDFEMQSVALFVSRTKEKKLKKLTAIYAC